MSDLYSILRPLLFLMEPELAHKAMLLALKAGAIPRFCKEENDPALRMILWGMEFPNPVGLAAGFDKDAQVIGQALELGFGFVEAGTVTPRPQEGNPPPRIFRFPEDAGIINTMGFPSKGMHLFKGNMTAFLERKKRPAGVVGINIGINKGQKTPENDYISLIRLLGSMADYLTVNISSPNTQGLRDLQKPDVLSVLLASLQVALKKTCGKHPPPLLVKLSPDLEEKQQKEVADVLLASKVDGIILTNTTTKRAEALPAEMKSTSGGLSGEPLKDKSTEIIRNFYRLTNGSIPIIGVGGISSGADAYHKIRAGASLVQLYSGLVFKGPRIAKQINTELLALLKKDGFTHIADAIGADITDIKQPKRKIA